MRILEHTDTVMCSSCLVYRKPWNSDKWRCNQNENSGEKSDQHIIRKKLLPQSRGRRLSALVAPSSNLLKKNLLFSRLLYVYMYVCLFDLYLHRFHELTFIWLNLQSRIQQLHAYHKHVCWCIGWEKYRICACICGMGVCACPKCSEEWKVFVICYVCCVTLESKVLGWSEELCLSFDVIIGPPAGMFKKGNNGAAISKSTTWRIWVSSFIRFCLYPSYLYNYIKCLVQVKC